MILVILRVVLPIAILLILAYLRYRKSRRYNNPYNNRRW